MGQFTIHSTTFSATLQYVYTTIGVVTHQPKTCTSIPTGRGSGVSDLDSFEHSNTLQSPRGFCQNRGKDMTQLLPKRLRNQKLLHSWNSKARTQVFTC